MDFSKLNRRDKALDKARKAFKNQTKEDSLQVPPHVEAERDTEQQGRHVTPVVKQSVEDDMKRPTKTETDYKLFGTDRDIVTKPSSGGALSTSHGQYAINQNAFYEPSNSETFAITKGFEKAFGRSAPFMKDLMGNIHFDYEVPLSAAVRSESMQYASALKYRSNAINKPVRRLFEEWALVNKRNLTSQIMVETAKQLKLNILY